MRIGILHIGDELLTGEIDPYPVELIGMVRSRRERVEMLQVIGDDEAAIVGALRHAEASGIQLLVVTGGLGPTLDDITREAVAAWLGTELHVDEEAAVWLEESLTRMRGRKVVMNDIIRRMARVPRGARAVKNITGAACGVEAAKGGMTVFCLPGFPNELVPMFREHILPLIADGGNYEKELTVWQGEAMLEPLFQEVVHAHDVRIASIPSLEWRSKGNKVVFKGGKDAVEEACAHFERLVKERFG
ncbi:competence/damage-inducible protein A [Methanomassiliicoccus luminyensis]|uniref:competence/damage-inducible protein A n=1 Tax=Methanomassiliicoccus luminyensis TaxID=1080712 RepID=UPI0003759420|nr:molybdopterin-binding protein [Methanomassiliicoccus luminyensis]